MRADEWEKEVQEATEDPEVWTRDAKEKEVAADRFSFIWYYRNFSRLGLRRVNMTIYDHMWGTNFIRMLKINTILYNVLGRIIWSQSKDVSIEYAKFFIA